MSYPNAIEVCRAELFTKEVELRERYPGQMVEKVLRVREMYNWFIANPDGTDREFVAEVSTPQHTPHYGVFRPCRGEVAAADARLGLARLPPLAHQ